ncbi:MAG: hypothetical protein H0U76_07305 [Ktedonobacteraceae bacterium]|nr:hypothetical protein [Ktedonobacteraceae bacterium]
MPSTVHIVHCIDTEGPLFESIEATFERLKAIFGLDLPPSLDLLSRLQSGQVDLGGKEVAVKKVLDPHLLSYNDTWDKIDLMLADALAESFRNELRDSFGGGWVYNWFCGDHVDYDLNPRRRDIGYHNVFDHYRTVLRETDSLQDGLHFHYHPHAFRREAHLCATHWWANSDSLAQTLSRRVIERKWFPAANRPGYHVTRPDSHWFLEQFIPFDLASQAITATNEDRTQFAVDDGRFGDWHRAPDNWQPYHPAHDDYQATGNCRRWIGRCLNVGTRYRLLTEADVRQAFEEARAGKPVVLGLTNHDFRDLRLDIQSFRKLLLTVSKDFPDVAFRFSEAVAAMRSALGLVHQPPCELKLSLTKPNEATHILKVVSPTPAFGPQPWLALKTSAGVFHYDNFDILTPFHQWQYVFDEETFPLSALSEVGVATNNAFGITTVTVLEIATGRVLRQLWNLPGDDAPVPEHSQTLEVA